MSRSKWKDIHALRDALESNVRNGNRLDAVNARKAVKALLERGAVEADADRLTKEGKTVLYACIVQPYSVNVFKAALSVSGPLVQILHWLVRDAGERQRTDLLGTLLYEKEYDPQQLSVKTILKSGAPAARLTSQTPAPSLSILTNLLKSENFHGQDMNALLPLLHFGLEHMEFLSHNIASSSDKEGGGGMEKADMCILENKELLRLFLDPLQIEKTCSVDSQPEDCKEILWTDGRTDICRSESAPCPRHRPDAILFQALQRAVLNSGSGITELLSNMTLLYKESNDFAKTQLGHVLKIVFLSKDEIFSNCPFQMVMASNDFNQILALDVVQFIFSSGSALLDFNISDDVLHAFIFYCIEHSESQHIPESFFNTCFAPVYTDSQDPQRSSLLLLKHLNLLSIFFSNGLSFFKNSCVTIDHLVALITGFLSAHYSSEEINPETLIRIKENIHRILNLCHEHCYFSVISIILNVMSQCPDSFSILSQCARFRSTVKEWPKQAKENEVSQLSKLFQDDKHTSSDFVLLFLNGFLQTIEGRQVLQRLNIDRSRWEVLRNAILQRALDSDNGEHEAVNCLIRLASFMKDWLKHDIDDIWSDLSDCLLRSEIEHESFALLMDFALKSNKLEALLSAALQRIHSKPRIASEAFIRSLSDFLHETGEKKLLRFFSVLKPCFSKLFSILEIESKGILSEAIRSLLRYLIVGRCSGEQYLESPGSCSLLQTSSPPFYSATFPEGRTSQPDSGQLNGLQKMNSLFSTPELSLESRDLRKEILDKFEDEDLEPSPTGASSFVSTNTTEEYIRAIQDFASNDHPVLLDGDTGVGKTATVMELALRQGKTPVRINMSSSLSPEDFLSRLTMKGDGSGVIVHDLQPFAKSFCDGNWVILDEMNLVEESALKVVIDAMESGQIVLCDPSSSNTPIKQLKKHPDFLLFATQNPWKAGKRERMSDAFMSHFSIMHFERLPKEEWEHIIFTRLRSSMPHKKFSLNLKNIAAKMIRFHYTVSKGMATCNESGTYTTITNRELLLWSDMITTNGDTLPCSEVIGECAYLIYGSRFRGDGKRYIRSILRKFDLNPNGDEDFSLNQLVTTVVEKCANIAADCQSGIQPMDVFWRRHFPGHAIPDDLKTTFDKCASAHVKVKEKILSPAFICKFGVYTSFSVFWLVNWISEAIKNKVFNSNAPRPLGQIGASFYTAAFRSPEAQNDIHSIFIRDFKLSESSSLINTSVIPDLPVVLNRHTCQHLLTLIRPFHGQHPVLLEGCAGSGKTCLAKLAAFLSGSSYEEVTLTPESEPSSMLGEYVPGNSNGSQGVVEWRDGPLTRSFKEGTFCIINNLGQAEAVIQERINPVLESPKYLCLAEKGDTEPLKYSGQSKTAIGPQEGFQLLATYTPKGSASCGYDSSSKNLTAALFNRFIVVHINDPAQSPEKEFRETLYSIVQRCVSEEHCSSLANSICNYCIKIRRFLTEARAKEHAVAVTSFRQFLAFVDVATYLFQKKHLDLKLNQILDCSLIVVFASQIQDMDFRSKFLKELSYKRGSLEELGVCKGFHIDAELILSQSRSTHASIVLTAAMVGKPALLQGKPAVGKTALITGLKKFAGKNNRVRILSNSDTTTFQDYFGSWMPSRNGFTYYKGSLLRAMEKGEWFIADEFNLAPVAVVAALMPFLEGARVIEIPGTRLKIGIHPKFRFFATQNPWGAGSDGRKLLPITVRNRFIEINIEGFPEEEFADIIYRRFEPNGENKTEMVTKNVAAALSRLYFKSLDRFKLTMRDLIKIVKRYVMLSRENENAATWANVSMTLLGPLASNEAERNEVVELISLAFGGKSSAQASKCMKKSIDKTKNGLRFRQGALSIFFQDFRLERSQLFHGSNGPPMVFRNALVDLAFAIKSKEPVVLYGEAAFKSTLIRTWLEIGGMQNQVQTVHLTSESEATELIGQVQLMSHVDVLNAILSTGCFLLQFFWRARNARQSKDATDKQDMQERCAIDSITNELNAAIRNRLSQLEGHEAEEMINRQSRTEEEKCDTSSPSSNGDESDEIDEYAADFPRETSPSADSNDDASDNLDGSSTAGNIATDVDQKDTRESSSSSSSSNLSSEKKESDTSSDSFERRESGDEDAFEVENIINRILVLLNLDKKQEIPTSVKRMMGKLRELKSCLRLLSEDDSRPCFIFNDGPFVKAITMKHVFVAEDYDVCPQSVTERLNSALEIDPTFSIPEDVTFCSDLSTSLKIPQEGYAFIATVHLDNACRLPRLSDATKSRMTQIRVSGYQIEDVIFNIADAHMHAHLHGGEEIQIPYVKKMILRMRDEVYEDPSRRHCDDFRQILRWISFICNHPRSLSLERRCFMGAEFCYLAAYPSAIREKALNVCFAEVYNQREEEMAGPITAVPFTFEKAPDASTYRIQLSGSGLSLETKLESSLSTEELNSKLYLCPTRTMVNNMARIFASICTDAPLLLEGPPGIGKTAIIAQVSHLIGTNLERINCSRDTSIEQLFGSVMPLYEDNKRRFKWRSGKFLQAMEDEKWILLDEINLLPSQTLEALIPLLDGSATHSNFSIPGRNGHRTIKVKQIRLFATMNPAAEGGDRTVISPSIKNLFTVTQLQPQDTEELQSILLSFFKELVDSKEIQFTKKHVEQIFEVYLRVVRLVESGEIQGLSRRQRFNLRDLAAVRDTVMGNIETQISHYRLIAGSDEGHRDGNIFDQSPVIALVVRKALRLIFRHRFESQEAQNKIQLVIDEIFKPPRILASETTSIDCSIGELIRIGTVYMDKDDSRSTNGSLVHTVTTVEQLELLATACQFQRTVMLEGATCSKKTALIKELATLIGRPLTVLSLHRDYEVSDLVGQWLPESISSIIKRVLCDILSIGMKITAFGMKRITKCDADDQRRFYSAMKSAHKYNEDELDVEQGCKLILAILDSLSALSMPEDERKVQSFMKRIDALKEELVSNADASDGVVFHFVKSELVQALEAGHFVLFDNINAAPPDVIESILSLFEEKPSLNLYQHCEGEMLTVGNGINPDTRLFATADTRRINTNKLSNPLLNRMIKIWLPAIDERIEHCSMENLKHHEVVEILADRFKWYSGGDLAARMAVCIHGKIKHLSETSKISIAKGTRVSFRMLLKAASVICKWRDNGECMFNATVWGLWRTYSAVVERSSDLVELKNVMQTVGKSIAFLSVHSFYAIRENRQRLTERQQKENAIRQVFASVAQMAAKQLMAAAFRLRQKPKGKKAMSRLANELLIRIHPEDASNILHEIEALRENFQSLTDYREDCKKHRCHVCIQYCEEVSKGDEKRIKHLEDNPDYLHRLCKEYISASSFTDWSLRLWFIEDMKSVIETLQELLKQSQKPEHSLLSRISEVVNRFYEIRHLVGYFHSFDESAFKEAEIELRACKDDCHDKALQYRLHRALGCEIGTADSDLITSIDQLTKHSGKKRRERNRLNLLYKTTALDWRTRLFEDERLLLFEHEVFSGSDIVEIQKHINRSKLMKRLQCVVGKLRRIDTEAFKKPNPKKGITGLAAYIPTILSQYVPLSGASGSTTEDSRRRDIASEAHLLFEEAMNASETGSVLVDDVIEAFHLHRRVFEDLRKMKPHDCSEAEKIRVMQSIMTRRSKEKGMSFRLSEFYLFWISLLNSNIRIPIPYGIRLCDDSNLKKGFIRQGSSTYALLLIAAQSDCIKCTDLIAMAVIETDKQDTRSKTVHHFSWSGEQTFQEEWFRKWSRTHHPDYHFVEERQKLDHDCGSALCLSRMGKALLACLLTMLSFSGQKRTAGRAHKNRNSCASRFVSEIKKYIDTYGQFLLDNQTSIQHSLFTSILSLDALIALIGGVNPIPNVHDKLTAISRVFDASAQKRVQESIQDGIRDINSKLLSEETSVPAKAYSFYLFVNILKQFPATDIAVCLNRLEEATEKNTRIYSAYLTF